MTATEVLLVDQDPVRTSLLSGQLEDAGYTVVTAGDADEALAALGDHPKIAGLAAAWDLPEVNGLKFIRQALKQGAFEGGVVLYDCPKPLMAEEKLEEWTDGENDFVVLEQPSDGEQVVEAITEVVGEE